MSKTLFSACAVAFLLAGGASPALAVQQEPFFKDKTVRIIVPFSPGGGFDTYSRLIARHMGKHIPGNPTIIVQNRPGAAGLIATKYIYSIAKPDGLTIGNMHGNVVIGQVLKRKGIDFDTRRFRWIGVPVRDTGICTVTKASGIKNLDEWLKSDRPVKLGGTGPGDAISDMARILKVALDLPIQLVEGYGGGARIRLAIESGEISGFCWAWAAAKATSSRQIEAGDIVVILQLTNKAHPDLPEVPLAIDHAKTQDGRDLIQSGIHDPQVILRSYVLPPGTPEETVQTMRRAFKKTSKDPAFLADAQKARVTIDPVTGEEAEKIVQGLFELNSDTLAKLREVLR